MTETLLPLTRMSDATRAGVACVLTDIDDTLTDHGRVGANVFNAMERLTARGIPVVPVTGRPAGWCDMIARTWPVSGVVGENGALAFRYDSGARRMHRVYADADSVRSEKRARLMTLAKSILADVPSAAIAADQAYRETDLAVDFAEDVGPLSDAEIAAIVAAFERAGATAKVSSIHVNGWFGDYDKLTMTRRFLKGAIGVDADADKAKVVFVGDSPNDSPMFAHFPNAVGVANLLEMKDRCPALPTWITALPRGAGFCEVADALLAIR